MLSHSYTSERNRTHDPSLSEAPISFTSSTHEMGSTDSPEDNHCAGGSSCGLPRHAPESDLYYDVELDLENDTELASPDQELSDVELANLLVNHSDILQRNHNLATNSGQLAKEHNLVHCNLEPGYGFLSPLNGTPSDDCNSEVYFDPVCSDTDKTRSDSFHDPINSSESDCRVSNEKTGSDSHKLPGRRREDFDKLQKQDTSESSSSVNGNLKQINKLNNSLAVKNSSEESLDAASSLDTTSPSHESLWSTFDESETVSLQNDSLSPSLPDQTVSKSHSDSEILPRVHLPTLNIESATSSDEVDFVCQSNHKEDKIVSHIASSYNDLSAASTGDSSTDTSSNDLPSAFVVDFLTDNTTLPATSNFKRENLENIEDGLRIEEISPSDNTELAKNGMNNLERRENKDEDDDPGEEEDEEEEKEPQLLRIRRCSSLKTGKTPPGTPYRKKIVRFADVLGLDLADVRTFLDEIPKVPHSAFSDLIYDDIFQKDSSPVSFDGSPPSFSRLSLDALNSVPRTQSLGSKPSGVLVPLFQQPGGLINFLDIVRERQVSLENVIVQNPVSACIQGTVRVRNLDFHKSVHIRYSLDSWKSYSDLQAIYLQNSCDGFSDKFSFQLYCRPLKIGGKLELAVRFQCKGVQYWDNNSGVNYCFQCLPPSQASNYIPITSSQTSDINDWSMNFY
ncbi:Similar to Gbs-76A: Glycogen-binding subunit 76A (Drosophila melanogaster) [Cotesia congregata]|uniref:Similar to Gbs-76A: Glycogen-binding subunit 76A (Drosophila melanogaster) n=1 Tax=Cotesia congregata TaxID=51543 RepID=A0A8J2H9C9_COTCN|nr:Similar to Gbs-76A: Glycogen-binding subunit 76A (Drosophila melanogaster) [Cotesia congregata]